MDYIYLLDQGCKNFDYLDSKNNVNFLMENQKNDLLLLDLENINYFFLIPEFDENNCYYFNLFISFKNCYISKNLLNLNFNVIKIKSISNVKNLSFLEIKNIFNFDKSKFSINKFDYRFVYILNIDNNKKKIDITPSNDEEQEKNIIKFFEEYNNNGDINKNENLRSEIKEILSKYLEEPSIQNKHNQLKKISYFFY